MGYSPHEYDITKVNVHYYSWVNSLANCTQTESIQLSGEFIMWNSCIPVHSGCAPQRVYKWTQISLLNNLPSNEVF